MLHVLRFRREGLSALIDAINTTGYGLTFGLHTRIDETIALVLSRIHAGNVYVNRNLVGAVVGVQSLGGEGLLGTGPKAGGPLYLHRLLSAGPRPVLRLGAPAVLPGPTGERNVHGHAPRGTVLCVAATPQGAQAQWEAVNATGNRALWTDTPAARRHLGLLPETERATTSVLPQAEVLTSQIQAALFESDPDALCALNQQLAARDAPSCSCKA